MFMFSVSMAALAFLFVVTLYATLRNAGWLKTKERFSYFFDNYFFWANVILALTAILENRPGYILLNGGVACFLYLVSDLRHWRSRIEQRKWE
jgi:hypothetical protein